MKIKLENVCYTYGQGTNNSIDALKNVNLEINKGEFIALIGSTGSGKSTLIQHLNGLMKPTSGIVSFDGHTMDEKGFDLKALRCQVGLVFQYPEHQLFEETLIKDVSFGPLNQGYCVQEAHKMAEYALKCVGIKKKYYNKSPFEISGGQKRRAAIAGVLAMNPEVLILDEPAAGLDPKGKRKILDMIALLQRQRGITVILVSHSMEDVAEYADRIVVMNQGEIIYDASPKEVFSKYKNLEQIGLSAPQVTYVLHELKKRGFDVETDAITVLGACEAVLKAYKERNK